MIFVEIIITKTESDALILEQGLISKKRPPFNIQFRDDKSYPAIHLSTSKDFPAIYVSRQKDPKSTIFGPFANVREKCPGCAHFSNEVATGFLSTTTLTFLASSSFELTFIFTLLYYETYKYEPFMSILF